MLWHPESHNTGEIFVDDESPRSLPRTCAYRPGLFRRYPLTNQKNIWGVLFVYFNVSVFIPALGGDEVEQFCFQGFVIQGGKEFV